MSGRDNMKSKINMEIVNYNLECEHHFVSKDRADRKRYAGTYNKNALMRVSTSSGEDKNSLDIKFGRMNFYPEDDVSVMTY
jgi:hypothetical protein